MNKQDALKKLADLEAETAKLRKIIEAPDEDYTQIKTFEDAFKYLGKDTTYNNSYSNDYKLRTITKAINKITDFKPDVNDGRQEKWRPFFMVDASGFRFNHSGNESPYAFTRVGSRLCYYFKTKEISDYFAKQFLDLHKELFYEEI